MTPDELLGLLEHMRQTGSDGALVEAKACRDNLSKNVWESISAFANTQGGWVLLGIDEASGFTPTTQFNAQRVVDQLVDGMGKGNPTGARLTNPPDFQIERHTVDDQTVVAVRINEAPPGSKPCYITARGLVGGSYKRIDDKDVRLTATEIFAFQHVLTATHADRQSVPDSSVEDLDKDLSGRLLEAHRGTRALSGTTGLQEQLRRLNVVTRDGTLSLAGALTVGSFPQQFFPRLIIDVAVHPGIEKSPADSTTRFLDRVLCDGPLAQAVNDAVAAVARNLRTTSVVSGAVRTDEPEIPLEVLREAIANAILHRAYDPPFQGQPVTVDVFADRVVVANPGGLWGGRTLENIGNGQSDCRNQFLLKILMALPLATGEGTVAEGNGSGVPFMVNTMKARALAAPEFAATPDRVEVTLARHGAAITAVHEWAVKAADRPLQREEESLLLALRENGEMTVQRLHALLKIDSDQVRSQLRALGRDGLVETCGPENYRLTAPYRLRSGGVDQEVLDALSAAEPLSIHAVADATGKSVNSLRPILRKLVQSGQVEPTAPPQSRHRRYLRRT